MTDRWMDGWTDRKMNGGTRRKSHELKDRTIEITQSQQQRKRNKKYKKEYSLRDL